MSVPPPESSRRPVQDDVLPEHVMREFERKNLQRALERCSYQISGAAGAAKLLGISPSTLAYRMKQLGLERPR